MSFRYRLLLGAIVLVTLPATAAVAAGTAPATKVAAICKFASQEYSEGALIANGEVCGADGAWSYPSAEPAPETPPAPPAKKK